MAVDKNKIIAEATRLVQKGQYDKALKAYEKVLAEDRKEVRILLKVGEIQQKKNDPGAAAATFNQVAEIYGEQGFFLKAVAVYKQIAKLTPDDVRVNEKLAALYQQLGLLNDATSQLQAVATAYERAGDQGRHLDVLRRLLDLDPENVVTCQRLGDLYARANRTREALELYRRAAAHLRENKRGDEYLKVAERIFHLTPDDLKLARELAQEYLARGDTKKALGKLQACHGADKQDVDTLRLMAQAFRDLGQVSKTIAVYRALARVYAERGLREDAALTWRLVLDLLPDDAEAREELDALGVAQGPSPTPPPAGRPPGVRPAAAPPAGPPPGVLRTPPPARPAATPPPFPRAPAPAAAQPAPPQPAAATAGPPATMAAIERVITETDVYVKYGLHQKALEHVQKVLATDPENPDALERVRDLRDTLGDRQGAAEAAERVVQALLARGADGRIDHAIERLRALDPSHADGVEEVVVLPPQESEAEPSIEVDEQPLPAEDEAIGAEPEGALQEVATAPEAPPAEPEQAPFAEAVVRGTPPVPPEERALRAVEGDPGPLPLLDDEMPPAVAALVAYDEAGPAAAPERVPPAPPSAAAPLEDEPVIEADVEPLELQEEEVVAVEEAGGAAPPQAVFPPLEAEMEEITFYERQGLLEEALLAVRELAAANPGHPSVVAALARLEALEAGAPAPPGAGPEGAVPEPVEEPAPGGKGYVATGTTGIFDLGAELSAELDPEVAPTPSGEFQYSVADVFDQFKRGLERTVRPDDTATKYDLGIAFQEMGMLDEALEQFRSALAGGDRKREVEILSMIGTCLGMKGLHEDALAAYRQALRSEFLTGDGAKALHFEIGAVHEALGDPEAALWYFQKIARGDPGYRNVADRVAHLGGGPGSPPGDVGNPASAPAPAPSGGTAPPGRRRPGAKNAGGT